MNKKLYVIIQVLVIILTFFISSICAMRTATDFNDESRETCATVETLSAENEQATTETQVTDEPETLNTQQTEAHQETQFTQSTEEITEPPQALETTEETSQTQPTETEKTSQTQPTETEETSQTQSTEAEEVPQETQMNYSWYYAYNTEEIEIHTDNNGINLSMPMFSIFKVLWVDEDNPSLLYIDYEGCLGYISNDGCIFEIPEVIELWCYFARTLCELNLRDQNGELIETIPMNSLVYVLGTPTNDYDRTTIISMRNGMVGTIAQGNVDFVNVGIFGTIAYQNVTLIVDGKLIARGDCVTGTENKKDTPKGAFKVDYIQENFTGLLGGRKSKYWVHFYDGCGFHDASWRKKFGGTIYRYGGSSGCVNCPLDLAKAIYEYSYIGMPVYIS